MRTGVLHGNLILEASGDLTMGGRTNPDGTIAVSDYDHNEADSLGNAVLTAPNPLAGYIKLARQVAAAGVKEITGNVIIDDRLFQPYNFRGEFDLKPIFVNDDVVDLTINPTTAGSPASVVSRPISAALGVINTLVTSATRFGQNPRTGPRVSTVHRRCRLHGANHRRSARRLRSAAHQQIPPGADLQDRPAFQLCPHRADRGARRPRE